MATKQASDVDVRLARETASARRALESASRYFDGNDNLTVNTLEAVYAQESSFGSDMGKRGSADASGHFQLRPDTAKRYGLNVSKNNDQRFNIDYASSAAARYLKDLDNMFGRKTNLGTGYDTIPISSASERKKFTLGAYNAGEGRISHAQQLALSAVKNPRIWADVQKFLEAAGAKEDNAQEAREYLQKVPFYESKFASKSPANKNLKQKEPRKGNYRCTEGHWRTIDDRRVFICD